MASGVIAGYLTWQAILGLSIFGATAYAAKNLPAHRIVRILLLLLTGCMVLALSMHRFPGFINPALAVDMRLSSDAKPFTHRANFDTAAAGLILLALFCTPVHRLDEWKEILRRTLPIVLGTLLCVLSLALAIGYIKVDFKLVPYTAVFLVANLFFTCATEEAFFRGFMQYQITQAMFNRRIGAYLAMLISAVLFGIAHARGGPVLIFLATLAGLGYGYAYLSTKRIEASILTHFSLNVVHFVAFTYPSL